MDFCRRSPSFAAPEIQQSKIASDLALREASQTSDPVFVAQTLLRCAVAAYFRGDGSDAGELARRSARIFEDQDANVGAAHAYWTTANIALECDHDPALAAHYYEMMYQKAAESGHGALRRAAAAAQFILAAETFDTTAFDAVRRALVRDPSTEQYQEKFSLVAAEALGFGWAGNLNGSETQLARLASTERLSAAQRAVLDALQSLIDAGRWELTSARRHSRSAIRRSAACGECRHVSDQRYRDTARILAASTCFIVGDRVRGARALSARFDAGRQYLALLTKEPIDATHFPPLFQGYAELIRISSACSKEARPRHHLTSTEVDLVLLLPSGATLGELARELGKSRNTVARQVESIYQKLDARNRAQAVEKARQLGVLS